MIKIQEVNQKIISDTEGFFVGVGRFKGKTYTVRDEHWYGAFENLREMVPEIDQTDKAIFGLGVFTGGSFDPERFKKVYRSIIAENDEKDRMLDLAESFKSYVLRKKFYETMEKIQQGWLRVRFDDGSLYVQTYDTTQEYYIALIGFLQELSEKYEVYFITVESYEEALIWSRVTLDEALTSKNFQEYLYYRW